MIFVLQSTHAEKLFSELVVINLLLGRVPRSTLLESPLHCIG